MKSGASINRTVISRNGVGLTASVVQRNDLFFHTFVTDYPSLILLRRGRKSLTIGGKRITILSGEAVALAAGTTCDVENETDDGQFESAWIVCSEALLSKAQKEFPNHVRLKDIAVLKGLGNEFANAFERGIQAISEPGLIPDAVAENRVRELLAWLAHSGFVFGSDGPASLQHKVRLMIGDSPGKNWAAKDIAKPLAMSETTFRRKLADEEQSFSGILVDVRMTLALTLLQATDIPISGIAYRVGYESASRFSVRFKKRFGFSPTAVRSRLPPL